MKDLAPICTDDTDLVGAFPGDLEFSGKSKMYVKFRSTGVRSGLEVLG
jgi:hypothetical protein